MFYKFSKGEAIYSVPNGLGDGSAYFNKSIARMTTGLNVLPSGTSPSTISCWFRYKKIERDYDQIIAYGSQNNSSMRGLLIHDNMLYSWGYLNDRTYENTNIEVNKWYHVVMMHENAKEKVYLNGQLVGERDFNFNTSSVNEVCIGKHGDSYYFCGNITNIRIFNRALTEEEVTQLYNKRNITDGLALYIPLQYGKDDSMFIEKTFVYDYSIVETSSGFNALGNPIRYRSASGVGVSYFTLPVKDGLTFFPDFRKGEAIDTVTKTSAELNNVVFKKYNGVDCAYFNGTNSSIIWKNVLTKSLPKFSLVVKFACTYTNGSWRFLFGVSPENNRALGCSLQMHNENNNQFCMIWDNSAFYLINGVEKEVFHVGILTVGDGKVKCYLDGVQVHHSDRTKELPTTSWLYVGGDYGQSNRLWFEGYIAQSILYDRALNEDEVKALSEV